MDRRIVLARGRPPRKNVARAAIAHDLDPDEAKRAVETERTAKRATIVNDPRPRRIIIKETDRRDK